MAAVLTGGCLCGAVRYELDAPFIAASYCHCRRCQRRAGVAASANGRVAEGSMRIVSGAEHVRGWQPPDGASKHFCGVCGSQLYSKNADGSTRAVRLGTVDGDPGIRPQWRQHLASAAPWEAVPDDGLPRFDGPRH